MAFDYSDLDATAVELIDEFGRDITVRRRDAATIPDPLKPWEPGVPVLTPGAHNDPVRAVQGRYLQTQRDGTTVQANDQRWFIAATGAPADLGPEWEIVVGSDVLQVINARPVQPGDTLLVWDLQVRA